MRTSSGSVRGTVPSPWHVGQTDTFFPVPWHRGHCTLNFMRPPVCEIWPVPLHCGHLPGASRTPCPLQLAQTSWREILRRITPPRIAVQKGTLTWYSRSVPGSGPPSSVAAPRPPPVKILEKISRKPPPLPEALRPPPRPPSNMSEKSNPPKSKWTPPAPADPAPCAPENPSKPPAPGCPPPRA